MSKHTPGPWRWEINLKHKVMHLVGGKPMFDLTIMDFDRWGMGGAVATLRDPSVDGMNIMHRVPDRMDWIEAFPGRSHHFDWCATVNHPDLRLIEAAPDLLEVLQEFLADYQSDEGLGSMKHYAGKAHAAIAKATGGAS